MSIVLEIKLLNKSYQKKKILNDLSFQLESGKFYTLLGQNGAGKSTLLKLLSRKEFPDSGDVYLFRENIFTDKETINELCGYVSEQNDFNLPMKVEEFSNFYGSFFKNYDKNLFLKLSQHFGLDLNQSYKDYSRGQKMQISFCLAAASRPKCLLLDEISSVLDAHARSILMEYLGQFVKEGGTVLMATNIVSEVQLYSDHLFLIKNGKLELNIPRHEFHLLFLKLRKKMESDHDVFHDPHCIEVGVNSDRSTSYLIPLKEVQNYKLPEALFDNRGITTEEIFIYYTKEGRS